MQLARASRSSDPFGRYYTDRGVAGLLVDSMASDKPKVVIDLGAGDGALVGAASRLWGSARFITVDIDRNAVSSCLQKEGDSEFLHHVCDALDEDLSAKIGLNYGSADSALCNPPFLRPKWRKHFWDILEDAGLNSVVPKLGCIPADILFIAQNLRFLRSGGKLGLILPDGIIAGEKCKKLRSELARSHYVERVIELPRRVFRNTDAKAHIVVLTKHAAAAETICLQRLEGDGSLTPAIHIPTERAEDRLDYSYLANILPAGQRKRPSTQLRDVSELVTRGSYSSAQRALSKFPVFHTSDLVPGEVNVPRRFSLTRAQSIKSKGVLARTGDILVARVGRNLEEKVCVVARGSVLLSDCFLLLRLKPQFRQRAFKYLTSASGRTALRAASHGVGARFITTDALLDLKF